MLKKMILITFFSLPISGAIYAQEPEPASWSFNAGGGVGVPLSDASKFVGNGANFVIGAGYNLRPALGLNTEFMWNSLLPKRSALNQVGATDGSARMVALTLNGILRLPPRARFGAYLIGGGGWYHRSGKLTKPVVVPGTACTPFYVWWGFTCTAGLVPANASLSSPSFSAFGGNIGAGLTLPFGGRTR